jgi:hypothetical protein
MAVGGFTRLPGGTVVVALGLPHPGCPEVLVRVVVHAANRQRALTRLSNLGFRGARLTGNAEPPTPDEVTAVLHHPDGLIWRDYEAPHTDPWHPKSALDRFARRRLQAAGHAPAHPANRPAGHRAAHHPEHPAIRHVLR